MYVRRGAYPTKDANDRYDNTYGTPYHAIEIRTTDFGTGKPLKAGTYYIGALAQGSTITTFNLVATLFFCPNNCSGHGVCNQALRACTCDVGYVTNQVDCSAPFVDAVTNATTAGSIRGNHFAFYRVTITDPNIYQLYIEMDRSAGTPDALPALMAGFDYFPSLTTNDGMVRDYSTPSQHWELVLSRPTTGDWIIGVLGSQDEIFNYTISFKLCSCQKCCSGHGTCQSTFPPACVCDVGYTGTADCSAPTVALTPDNTVNITIDAYGVRYFRVDVTTAEEMAHMDMAVVAVQTNTGTQMIRMYASPFNFPSEQDYWYSSPLPVTFLAEVVVPHADLFQQTWYFAVYNKAGNVAVIYADLVYQGWCPCASGQGTCPEQTPALCVCNGGNKGAACDIGSTDESGVSVGTVVAVVIVLFAVGIAIGIIVKRQYPQLCARKGDIRLQ